MALSGQSSPWPGPRNPLDRNWPGLAGPWVFLGLDWTGDREWKARTGPNLLARKISEVNTFSHGSHINFMSFWWSLYENWCWGQSHPPIMHLLSDSLSFISSIMSFSLSQCCFTTIIDTSQCFNITFIIILDFDLVSIHYCLDIHQANWNHVIQLNWRNSELPGIHQNTESA